MEEAKVNPKTRIHPKLYLVVFCVACFLLFVGLKYSIEGISTKNWILAEGVVVKSEMEIRSTTGGETMGKQYDPIIQAIFEVNGKEYVCDTKYWGGFFYKSKDNAIDYLRKHPKGSIIKVYYNPKKPEQSLFEPGDIIGPLQYTVLCSILLVASFWVKRHTRTISPESLIK